MPARNFLKSTHRLRGLLPDVVFLVDFSMEFGPCGKKGGVGRSRVNT
jgi:hypothetical protein